MSVEGRAHARLLAYRSGHGLPQSPPSAPSPPGQDMEADLRRFAFQRAASWSLSFAPEIQPDLILLRFTQMFQHVTLTSQANEDYLGKGKGRGERGVEQGVEWRRVA